MGVSDFDRNGLKVKKGTDLSQKAKRAEKEKREVQEGTREYILPCTCGSADAWRDEIAASAAAACRCGLLGVDVCTVCTRQICREGRTPALVVVYLNLV